MVGGGWRALEVREWAIYSRTSVMDEDGRRGVLARARELEGDGFGWFWVSGRLGGQELL